MEGFIWDGVYVTVDVGGGERRFMITCENCRGVVEDNLTEDEAGVAESLHRSACPNMGKAVKFVT